MPSAGDFIFLNPAGLWALWALAIPVLIHLFSRSRGRRVLVGHIELVRLARQKQVTELRLRQWLLLLLRCLIVVLAVLMLAGLARPGLDQLAGDTHYVTTDWWNAANESERTALPPGSRLLAADFPLAESLAGPVPDTEPAGPLAQRLSDLRHHGTVTVYSTGMAANLPDPWPALPNPIEWRFLPNTDNVPGPMSDTLRAVITHAPTRFSDAQRVEAALEVLQAHRLPGLQWVRVVTGEPTQPAPADWVIDLQGDPAPWLAPGTSLLTEAPGPGLEVDLGLRTDTWPHPRIRIQRINPLDESHPAPWRLPSGQPLLTRHDRAGVDQLTYASRLADDWSDLARTGAFPQALMALMLDEEPVIRLHGHNPVSSAPAGEHLLAAPAGPARNLAPWLALWLALAWLLERWVAERRTVTRA